MKVIIAGSRDINDYNLLISAIEESKFKITEIVSGTANGVDKLGELYGKLNNITVKQFPADWNKYGKSAGYKRNEQMAQYGNALIAIWNGSKGTKHMIDLAEKYELKIYVKKI